MTVMSLSHPKPFPNPCHIPTTPLENPYQTPTKPIPNPYKTNVTVTAQTVVSGDNNTTLLKPKIEKVRLYNDDRICHCHHPNPTKPRPNPYQTPTKPIQNICHCHCPNPKLKKRLYNDDSYVTFSS